MAAGEIGRHGGILLYGRGTLANLAFAAYAFLLQKPLLAWSVEAVHGKSANLPLGVALVAALVLEPFLIRARLRQLAARLVRAGTLAPGDTVDLSGGILLWLLHLLAGTVLALVALSAFGLDFERDQGVGGGLIVLQVVRELVILGIVAGARIEAPAPRRWPRLREAAVDVGLVLFACTAYTATWQVLASTGEPLNQLNLGLTLVYTAVSGLLFLIFYLPTRLAYLLEESFFTSTASQRRKLRASIALAALGALSPLFVFEDGSFFVTTSRAKQIAAEGGPRRAARREASPDRFLEAARTRADPRRLHLDGGPVAIPASVGGFTGLVELHVTRAGVRRLPPEIGALVELRSLALNGNKLEAVPAELFGLPALETLLLSYNELRAFPLPSGALPSLRHLGLGMNPLKRLPAALTGLAQLRSLDVGHTGLAELPEDLGRLENLERLDLRGNELRRLPASIVRLQRLEALDLSRNGLTELPPEVLQLGSLEYLKLMDNRIARLPDEAAKLRLEHLDLQGNPIGAAERERIRRMLPAVTIRF